MGLIAEATIAVDALFEGLGFFQCRIEQIRDFLENSSSSSGRGRGPINTCHPIAAFEIDQLTDGIVVVYDKGIIMPNDRLTINPYRARTSDQLAFAVDRAPVPSHLATDQCQGRHPALD